MRLDFLVPYRQTLKMIRHIVMFKFKPGASEDSKAELVSNLDALYRKIEDIQAFERGLNNSKEGLDHGYTHLFLLTFKDETARDTYVEHPEHRKFVKENLEHVDSVLAVDYSNSMNLSR